MRILMVNKFLYPRAGAETYMLQLAESLIKEGHEVAFFGMDHPEKTKIGPTYTVKTIEFNAKNSALYKTIQLTKAFIQNFSIKKKLKQCCESFKPDMIHAHNVYNQLPPSLFKAINIPVIMTVHDYKPVCPSYNLFSNGQNCDDCLKGSFTHCIKKKCVQNSLIASTISAINSWFHKIKGTYINHIDYYIAPSHFMKKKLTQGGLPSYKIQVIHNFTSKQHAYRKPGKQLLYAGRICQEKGVDTLIEAFETLPLPRPLLTICGTGPLKRKLENYTQEKGLNIKWLGFVSPAKVEEEMIKAKATIVPSIWNENCSMTIMESLANNRPVIASNTGGNCELINPGYNGFTFQAGNSKELASRIELLVKSDCEDLCKNAGTASLNYFSNDHHLKNILKIYNKFYQLNNSSKKHTTRPALTQELMPKRNL